MKNLIKLVAPALVALSAFGGTASAQDYLDWAPGSISPWGMEMYDPYGNSVFVDP